MTAAQSKSARARAERQIVARVRRFDEKKAERTAYWRGQVRLFNLALKGADAAGRKMFRREIEKAKARLIEWINKRPPVTYSGRAVAILAGC
jgi:hypothetical protein